MFTSRFPAIHLPCCTTGAGVTSVTAGGLGVWAAGGTEQVGLFISRTGRLSPLGGGWNILKTQNNIQKD